MKGWKILTTFLVKIILKRSYHEFEILEVANAVFTRKLLIFTQKVVRIILPTTNKRETFLHRFKINYIGRLRDKLHHFLFEQHKFLKDSNSSPSWWTITQESRKTPIHHLPTRAKDGNGILCCHSKNTILENNFWQQRYSGQPDTSLLNFQC